MGFALPFSSDSSSSNSSMSTSDLFHHLQMKHGDDQQSSEVICPICAAMSNGEPNLVTADLVAHIANDHQHSQVQTPSSAGGVSNPYSRQPSSNRDFDFSSGSGTRASFRRGPLRAPSRRGTPGRGGGTVSQHFVVDTSAVSGASDPIADLLTQLSTVRRLAAANNNNSSSSPSSPNTINLQTLTRQQYERERLRAVGRSHHNTQPSSQTLATSNSASSSSTATAGGGGTTVLPSVENDFFDSLFASALFVDPLAATSSSSSTAAATATTNSQQTWAQIVAQQQQQPSTPVPEQQPPSSKAEPDPSLLRKICDEAYSSPSGLSTNSVVQQQKRRTEFVHSLLLSTLMCPLNDHDK